MQSGLAYQGNEPPSDGSMAVFCPACPQPGINLPNDWNTRYKPYAIIIMRTNSIVDLSIAMNLSAHSLWMETFQLNIWDADPKIRKLCFLPGWHLWQIQTHTKHICVVLRNLFRWVKALSVVLYSFLHSPTHAIHTRPLNKLTPVDHTLMLQASEQPPVAMDSLSQHLWWTFRRVRGVSNLYMIQGFR